MTQALNKKQIVDETAGVHQLVLDGNILNRNQIVDETMASKVLVRATQTLRNDRHMRRGCPYIRLGRSIRYRVGDLLDYLEKHRIDPETV